MISVLLVAAAVGTAAPAGNAGRVDLRFVPDEPEAVLAILDRRAAGRPIDDASWDRLFASEGFVRWQKREAAFHAETSRDEFRAFVLSDALLAKRAGLAAALAGWSAGGLGKAADRAFAYLPPDARIRATVYPMIKPRSNSFVFEVPENPAIFLALEPGVSRDKFENTVAHELHHIGYGSACPHRPVQDAIAKLPEATRTALTWVGAFGEGFAMLAAAGGPDVHPHAVSPAADRERWDRDLARFPEDLRTLEKFFRDVLDGRLSSEQAQEKAMTFFGEQGPWYTVGWKMCVTIEKAQGRDALIAAMCDPREILAAYDRAAARDPALPRWSADVVERLRGR